MKESDSKGYMLYESNHMTFLKRKTTKTETKAEVTGEFDYKVWDIFSYDGTISILW